MLQSTLIVGIAGISVAMASTAWAQSSCKYRVESVIVAAGPVACTSGQGNPRCQMPTLVKAKEGFQACSPLYEFVSRNNKSGVSISASDRYLNDPEKPSRFRSFVIEPWAHGDPWPGAGSNVSIKNVGLTMIPAEATNKDRFECGCMMLP